MYLPKNVNGHFSQPSNPLDFIQEHKYALTNADTLFNEEKQGPIFFPNIIFLSVLIVKFHINITADKVFEFPVSHKKFDDCFSMVRSVHTKCDSFGKHWKTS